MGGREAERLTAGRGAAAGRDAAELRHGEGERKRRERGVEKARPCSRPQRRHEQEPGGDPEQAADAREERTEREAGDEARRPFCGAETRARSTHRHPECGT